MVHAVCVAMAGAGVGFHPGLFVAERRTVHGQSLFLAMRWFRKATSAAGSKPRSQEAFIWERPAHGRYES